MFAHSIFKNLFIVKIVSEYLGVYLNNDKQVDGDRVNIKNTSGYWITLMLSIRILYDYVYEDKLEFRYPGTINLNSYISTSAYSPNMVIWLVEHDVRVKNQVQNLCEIACKQGNLQLLQWSIQNKFNYTTKVMLEAVKSNSLDIVQWITSNFPQYDFCIDFRNVCWAASYGHEEIVKFLLDKYYFKDKDELRNDNNRILPYACMSKSLSLVQLLVFKYEEEVEETCLTSASEAGSLSVLKWLVSQYPNVEISSECVYLSAANGHIDVLQWLLSLPSKILYDSDILREYVEGDFYVNVIYKVIQQDLPVPPNLRNTTVSKSQILKCISAFEETNSDWSIIR